MYRQYHQQKFDFSKIVLKGTVSLNFEFTHQICRHYQQDYIIGNS